MRHLINLLETTDEYSTKGHAGMKIRPNDPRFGDNPMDNPTELDEFDSVSMKGLAELDRLHAMLNDADVTDQEIMQGIQLSATGLHKAAAALGTDPQKIEMLLSKLMQKLSSSDEETLEESYQRFVEAEATTPPRPFDAATDDHRFSAEPDYLGDLTVRKVQSGKEKFFRGSQAADISDALRHAATPAAKQAVLEPLIEDDADAPATGFADEIAADSGSYNFPWNLHGQSGFGTAFYSVAGGKPTMKLVSIRDAQGNDVDADGPMRQALLHQAQDFIGDA